MHFLKIAPKLYLIPLEQALPGFTGFIGAWLHKGEKTFLVDVGPAATIPILLNALETLEVRSIDAILLTHIHIDHAGGIGDMVSGFPDTPVVCHAAGIPHLMNPDRLWEGSLKALGPIAEAYGPFRPVSPTLLMDAELFSEHEILPILTPGHSPHHVSYRFGPFLFAGEAGGVFLNFADGDFYLRPATPHRFFLETSVRSIDTLLETPHEMLCYGHFGMTRLTPRVLHAHRHQLFRWADVIRQEMHKDQKDDLDRRCFIRLLAEDPLLAGWKRLEGAVQEREREFLLNSIHGFCRYLETS
jgi:glyoxylase-like metal-dependent hydrolase (beta-lactamase superfamily II)